MPLTTLRPGAGSVEVTDDTSARLIATQDDAARLLAPQHLPWCLIEHLDHCFATHPGLKTLILDPTDWQAHSQWSRLTATLGAAQVHRAVFYQQPWHWLQHAPAQRDETPFDPRMGHPRRPAKPDGEVYRRHVPRLGRTLSLRVIDKARDLERFTRWMHLPRVAEFWEQAWPKAELAAFIDERLADPHCLPLIGEFDDQPFGYFDVYWAAEDRIAAYYPWEAFDRGLHLLVGEEDVRGPRFVDAWLTGLSHYAYLSEPRTTRLVLEPRHDNRRLFRHLERQGLSRRREFDFPHKRAALVMGERDHFFREVL
nr:GNAT family N-acetyltransferase [uncultured Halomonas sp.]